jgi:hypothetical protein
MMSGALLGKKANRFLLGSHLDRTLWVKDNEEAQFKIIRISSNNFFYFSF